MLIMIAGLLLFLGTHSIRMFANDWRTNFISNRGKNTYTGILSIVALLGVVLIVWGYGQARLEPNIIWEPPVWTKHIAALLLIPSFILLVASIVPGTKIKSLVGHPMVLGVKLWALAHLLANGMLVDIILFGAFLTWSVFNFSASRRRDKADGNTYPAVSISRDVIAVIVGIVFYGLFAAMLHNWLIGVKPFG